MLCSGNKQISSGHPRLKSATDPRETVADRVSNSSIVSQLFSDAIALFKQLSIYIYLIYCKNNVIILNIFIYSALLNVIKC